MSIKESDIIYEDDGHYIAITKQGKVKAYTVFKPCYSGIAVESDSSYELTEDGLSIAKARMKYLIKQFH